MKTSNISRAIALTTLLLCSQTGSSTPNNADLDTLKSRIQARWQALAEKQYEKAYTLETPNYRKVFPVKLFLNKFALGSTSQLEKILDVKYDPKTRVANVLMTVKSHSTRASTQWATKIPLNSRIREKWLNIDGQWYHVNHD